MAALKWEIWETMPHGLRAEYGHHEVEKRGFAESILGQWRDRKTGRQIYAEELVGRRTYKEKQIRYTNSERSSRQMEIDRVL